MQQSLQLFISKYNIRWLYLTLADVALIWGAYGVYVLNQWYAGFLGNEAKLALLGIAVFYTIVCIISNIGRRYDEEATSPGHVVITALAQLARKAKAMGSGDVPAFYNAAHKTKFLFILVKLFFIPIMVQFTVGNSYDLQHEIKRVMKTGMDGTVMLWFNNIFFPLAITIFFLVDTLLFTFGYLFESRRLGNKIRSVEPTWSGWIVALICYPPMNQVLSQVAPQYTSMYAYFDTSITGTFVIRILIAALIFVYAWASLSLGTRCSNLTNRGITTSGAYAIVRHPAYISKVAAWWVTLSPILANNPWAIGGMLVWTLVYYLRATTEERHLSADPDYIAYCQKVKYRFIPGVI